MTHVQTEIPKHPNLTARGALTFPVGRLHRVEVARMVMAKNHLEHPTQLARAKHLDCPLGPRKKWKFRATPDKAFGRRCRFRYLLCGAKVEPKRLFSQQMYQT